VLVRRRVWKVAIVIVVALASYSDVDSSLAYNWDDRRVLCSQSIDDLLGHDRFDIVERQLAGARAHGRVALLHAHVPGITVSRAMIERVLALAERDGLATLTYRDLGPRAPHRAGVALSSNDSAVDAWFALRDVLARHRARVTFFVTHLHRMSSHERAELALLARDGHDIEPHSVAHRHAIDYVAHHGVDAYIADEVLPSLRALADAGFPAATTFAYPFGDRSRALDAAVLRHVARVRTTRAPCPW
jgi:hypothetical protein